jgi:subtilase family serine protease
MSARKIVLAATACTLFSAVGVAASSADAAVRPAGGFPAAHGFTGAAGPPTSAECMKALGVACYSPVQVERAYDLPPLYGRGLDGRGRTIVIVDPFGSPTIGHDLRVFDRAFGLPAPPAFRVLQPVGPVPPFNPKNPGMVEKAGETTGDVELAHEIAPGANILLVETPVQETVTGGGFPEFIAAENYVIKHNLGDVISQSFSLPEQNFPSRSALLRLRYAYVNARRHHVTVLAASNDFGVTGPTPAGTAYLHPVVYWPASDPLVTGVGGTRLHLNAAGDRTSPDTAWNDSRNKVVEKLFGALPWASGGGLSAVFGRPAYQDPVRGITGNHRGVPDVSLSASLSGAVLIFESYTGAPGIWAPGGGTSAATPEFAGIVAIADQYAHKRLGLINPALYRLEQEYAPGLVDVTKGSNTVSFTQGGRTITIKGYRARPGYDLVTGVGTIDAARFVPELARTG